MTSLEARSRRSHSAHAQHRPNPPEAMRFEGAHFVLTADCSRESCIETLQSSHWELLPFNYKLNL